MEMDNFPLDGALLCDISFPEMVRQLPAAILADWTILQVYWQTAVNGNTFAVRVLPPLVATHIPHTLRTHLLARHRTLD